MKAPIIGPKSAEKNSKIITTIPVKGVSQGTRIGLFFCNLVLDGLESFLIKPFFFKSNKKFRLPNNDFGGFWSKTGQSLLQPNVHKDIKIYSLRYLEELFIFGKCSLEQLKVIQLQLISFLKQKSVSVKGLDKFLGKIFNCGTKFNFLGFKFLFPHFNKELINQGKYTRLRYSPVQVENNAISAYKRSGPIMLIQPCILKCFFNRVKNVLSPKNTSTSVASRIIKLNLIIQEFYNYFAISATCRAQLKRLGFMLFTQFKKFLIRKYRSANKIRTYVFKKHFDNELKTFYEDKTYLIKPQKIFLYMETPSMGFLKPLRKQEFKNDLVNVQKNGYFIDNRFFYFEE